MYLTLPYHIQDHPTVTQTYKARVNLGLACFVYYSVLHAFLISVCNLISICYRYAKDVDMLQYHLSVYLSTCNMTYVCC